MKVFKITTTERQHSIIMVSANDISSAITKAMSIKEIDISLIVSAEFVFFVN